MSKEKDYQIPKPTQNGKVAKVPVIVQMEELECAAASLGMILAYYGLWLPLEKLRVDCDVSRDGVSANKIVMTANMYGLSAKGFKLEPDQLRDEGLFPCIVHVGFNHFVVVNGFKGNKVIINDPAAGKIEMNFDAFDEWFTGITLMLVPNADFVPGGSRSSVTGFIKKRLHGAHSAIAFAIVFTILASVLAFIQPAFLRVLVDRLLSGQSPEWLYPFIWIMVGIALIQLALAYVKAENYIKIEGKLAVSADTSFFWHILHLPMEFFGQRMAGDLILRQETNSRIASSIINTLAPLAINLIMMFVYLGVLLKNSFLLTVIGLGAVIINLFTAGIISKKRINFMRTVNRNIARKSGTAMTGIQSITTIKASGAENSFFSRWAGTQASEYLQRSKQDEVNVYWGGIPSLVSSLTDIAILSVGVLLSTRGDNPAQVTIGMLLAFQGFLNQFKAPAASLIQAGQTTQEMRVDMERVEDVMQYERAIKDEDNSDATSFNKLSGNIEIKDLTFGYAKLSPPIIKNFSMSLKPGNRVAIVGSSGCGKSTIAKLLAGLYTPWSGTILFDGIPIGDIPRSVFLDSVAMVDQNIKLFEDTISNNIKMWDKTIEDFEVIMAANEVQLHKDIMQRNGGYSCVIHEDGKDFSGGQRQRMEIARVLAGDPSIIIMDEATSSLDAATEYEVVKSIKERGIVCVIVAHRLSTIRDCDEIIVLDHGSIVERGTHSQLYALGGYYTSLVNNA